jgi:hypothetical protein
VTLELMPADAIPALCDTGRRFCDLVVGAITSGIVFPKAVAQLFTQYRFRHIGGTSAGGFAVAGAPQWRFAGLAMCEPRTSRLAEADRAFARPANLASGEFTYHRWVRVRSLLGVLQRMLRDIHQGAPVLDHHPPYPDLIRYAPAHVGTSYRLSDGVREPAKELPDALDTLDRDLESSRAHFARTKPRPAVELRIQPLP